MTIGLLVLASPATSAKRADVTIKFATLAPDGSTWMKVLDDLDHDLRARTENRVGFKFYPGGVQGDELDVLRKIRNGQLHAGGFSGFGLGAVASEFRAIEVPFMFRTLDDLDQDLRARTQNRVGFKFYPGGVQGDELDVLRKIRNGQLHAGGFSGFGLGAVASEFRAIEVPFMFRTLDEVDHVREEMTPYYKQLFDEKGYVLLGWADVGFVYLYSNTPIHSPRELRQAKVWTWSGDKLAELFFRAFEVSPIPLALPDVLTSLQMGVIDAVYAPPLACIALQWFTRVKYMTDVPITYGFGAVLVSKKSLRKVSPADRAVLEELAAHYSAVLVDRTRVQNAEAIESIREEGVELLEVDPETERIFFTTGRSAWKDGVGTLYPKALLDRVSATVEAYRKSK